MATRATSNCKLLLFLNKVHHHRINFSSVHKKAKTEEKETSEDQDVVATKERFWILLQYGFCTMINACGWMSIAPIYALVEDVSDPDLILNANSF